MNYVKVENDRVVSYPYTTLHMDHPNVSFPLPLTDEVLAAFNVFSVQPTPQPMNRWYQVVEEINPRKTGRAWVQQWQVIHIGTNEQNALIAKEWERLRLIRNEKLSATDWTQLPDSPVDKSVWASYRQALRDLPKMTANPFEAVWPEEPE
ncbi:tail fiber assembly protein [Aestuariivirga sp.]|jgi:hypothetical protein|uniref:tail fiber assembly protein n=1 Tax=Aestuariivirga sp. TaxID=2650926 RepID=UPI00378361A0